MTDLHNADRTRLRNELVDDALPTLTSKALQEPEIAGAIAQYRLDSTEMWNAVIQAKEEVLIPAYPAFAELIDLRLAAPRKPSSVTVSRTIQPRFDFSRIARLGKRPIGTPSTETDARFKHYNQRMQDATDRWKSILYSDGVLPLLRRLINDEVQPPLLTSLTVTDAPGLERLRDSSFVVRTSSVIRFEKVASRVVTGAIGLAGPRGAGKTTAIDYYSGRQAMTERGPIRVTVSAPVRYEPRDFMLHLYAVACRALLDRYQDDKNLNRSTHIRRIQRVLLGHLAVVILLMSGAALAGNLATGQRLIVLWVLAALGAIVLVRLLWVLARTFKRLSALRRSNEYQAIKRTQEHLRRIRFLQTQTTGWSGKLTLPLGSDAGWTRSVQLADRALTYPEIVADLRAFLDDTTQFSLGEPAVIVAIDELDKIGSADEAQKFVNEIKGLFGVARTQFLVSVSEDALASFEQRGLPVRDAFDSAFDEIVRIDHLSLADTYLLLNGRVIGMPEPFLCLAHCMSGGLARDVIRVARSMVSMVDKAGDDDPLRLDDVCGALLRDDVNAKRTPSS
jgi:hypothetical protein